MAQISKARQIAHLHMFCTNGSIKDTLLADLLLDSLEMLRGQINSDFSYGNFRNYAEEISQLKNSIISLQHVKNLLLVENKELESEVERLRNSAHNARKDVEALSDRLERVLSPTPF